MGRNEFNWGDWQAKDIPPPQHSSRKIKGIWKKKMKTEEMDDGEVWGTRDNQMTEGREERKRARCAVVVFYGALFLGARLLAASANDLFPLFSYNQSFHQFLFAGGCVNVSTDL
jgi:hypothetical protein